MMTGVLKRTMLVLMAAFASLMAIPSQAQPAPDIAGAWHGTIALPQAEITLALYVTRGEDGALTAKIENVGQNPGHPADVTEITVTAGHLAFRVAPINASYEGDWDEAAQQWQGTLTQGQAMPLDFAKGAPPLRLVAPAPVLRSDWQLPLDGEIGQLIAARNAPRVGQGIVVGVLGPDGRRIVAGGSGPGAAFDGSTLFEIGSITKVFTALILADMANKGEVSLDDPAAKYLPPGRRMPERNGHQITLRDLSTHRSGLPRMADDMRAVSDPDGPFADYDEERLLAFFDRYRLQREIGSQWEYSNLGVGLLGYLLARAAGTDYETLLRERITGPLDMDDTLITLPSPHAARLAAPLDTYMRPARPWNLSVLTAAGGIRSTAEDMLRFAAAVLDPNSPIAPAMRKVLSVRAPASNPTVEQALGWVAMHPEPGREILFHDGGTGGFRSVLALEPARGAAVVALVNSAAEPSPADIALHILIGSPVAPTPPVPPAPPSPTERTEISWSAAELDKVVGRYDFGDGFLIAVTREEETLLAQREGIPGAPALPIFPEASLAFFWKAVDAQLRFITDASGAVTGAEFTQSGQSLTGRRLEP